MTKRPRSDLYGFGAASTWSALELFIAGRVDEKLITAHWDDAFCAQLHRCVSQIKWVGAGFAVNHLLWGADAGFAPDGFRLLRRGIQPLVGAA